MANLPLNAEEIEVQPGLEKVLAQKRKRLLTDVSYRLRFSFPASLDMPFVGHAQISFVLLADTDALILDFKETASEIKDLQLDGKNAVFSLKNQHLVLSSPLLAGPHSLVLSYKSKAPSIKRQPDFLYSLFVPDRASQAFPCFDQPDIKGKFSLQIEIPSDWQAISNEHVLETRTDGLRTTYQFATTPALSTYLLAFAAGRFHIAKRTVGDREINMFYRDSDEQKVSRNADAIFNIHSQALKKLSTYTGIAYPFSKLDIVLLPSFEFGGMEHPGAIFYNESDLFLDMSASQNQVIARANVISHEVSHMWFGDLVTMKWFDDVWLKEVMANFLAAKVTEPLFPEFDHRLKFYLSLYPGAYDIDRTEGTHSIRQRLDNLQKAGSVYGSIIYLKSPILMKQLELLLGQRQFRNSIRDYLKTYQFSNASWDDLVHIFETHFKGKDSLKSWSQVWIDGAGRPEIQISKRAGVTRAEQTDPKHQGRIWPQVFSVLQMPVNGTRISVSVRLNEKSTKIDKVKGDAALVANSTGVGYGFFRLRPQDRKYLLNHLADIQDPLARAVSWTSLWDDFYAGDGITTTELSDLAFQSATTEMNDLIVEYILNRFSSFYWKFLRPDQRIKESPRWEKWLWTRLSNDKEKGLKPVYWQTYLSIAQSPEAIARLKNVWSGDIQIPALSLSENDYMNLGMELALRLPHDAQNLLKVSSARIQNEDRRAEFEFLQPALSAKEQVRRDFFLSFKSPSNRKREQWVTRALYFIGHPLRTNTEFMIKPGLELLEDIQNTGDIFFPLSWCQAIFRGHQSAAAATVVRDFLDQNPRYPVDLKNKILQAADLLFRSAKLDKPEKSI